MKTVADERANRFKRFHQFLVRTFKRFLFVVIAVFFLNAIFFMVEAMLPLSVQDGIIVGIIKFLSILATSLLALWIQFLSEEREDHLDSPPLHEVASTTNESQRVPAAKSNSRPQKEEDIQVIRSSPFGKDTPPNTYAEDDKDSFFISCNTDDELHQFCQDHPLIDEFYTKVVGVTYDNDDGTSRQRILSYCRAGDPLAFIPYSFKGAPALAVTSKYGQIGNLSADLAAKLEYDYDCDLILSGTISEITGGQDGLYYGCNLHMFAYKA